MQNAPWTKVWSFFEALGWIPLLNPTPEAPHCSTCPVGKEMTLQISSPSTCDFFWDTQVKFLKDISLEVKMAGPQFPNLHSGYQEKSYLDQKAVLRIKLKNEKTNRKVHSAIKIWALMGFSPQRSHFGKARFLPQSNSGKRVAPTILQIVPYTWICLFHLYLWLSLFSSWLKNPLGCWLS